MNKAKIGDKTIEDGDFLVIDSSKKNPQGKGEIVLSIIDGAANVKKIYKDENSLVLVSDSTRNYTPIYVDPADDFLVNGRVISVMKKPKI